MLDRRTAVEHVPSKCSRAVRTPPETEYLARRDNDDDDGVVVVDVQLKSLNQNRFKARSRIYEAASECDVVTIQ